MERRDLARAIYRVAHLTGEFRLRSGVTSHEYFDKYRFEAEPILLRQIAEAMHPLIPGDAEVLAGLELGGVPIVTILSQVSGLPAAFVRKAAKTYGTERLAEGADVAGRRVVVIEDVITSGGQVIESVRELQARGAIVDTVLCVIDRDSGGAVRLQQAGIRLHALFGMSELAAAAT